MSHTLCILHNSPWLTSQNPLKNFPLSLKNLPISCRTHRHKTKQILCILYTSSYYSCPRNVLEFRRKLRNTMTCIPGDALYKEGQDMPEQDKRPKKDTTLRQDIRILGNTLGQAIRRHEGEAVFTTVEQLRSTCIRLRDCTRKLSQCEEQYERQLIEQEITALSQEILQIVHGCDFDTAIDVI